MLVEDTITISKKDYEAFLNCASLVLILQLEVLQLKEQIRLLINGKKSDSSNTPPSQQIGRSNSKSLRLKSDRKSGGQLGHKGCTLPISLTPSETIMHDPLCCSCCGESLEDVAGIIAEKRQEVIIPPIQAKYVEHITSVKKCCRCGNTNRGIFPVNINAPIQYSSHITALVCYLSVYQHLPYFRLTLLMKDLFGISLSEGTVDNMLKKATLIAQPVYEMIQDRIQKEEVIGGDETGTRINGKLGWFFVWQSKALTFIAASMSRGYKTILQYFPNGFPTSVYVSDCLSAQLKVLALLHQLCIAHLLRELNNFEDALSCKWSTKMKTLLCEAIELDKQFSEQDNRTSNEKVIGIEVRLENLLTEYDEASTHNKVKAFIGRLQKNKASILTFLKHHYVPPDNNASERAIRNIKIKAKVSTQFRSHKGAKSFATLRSVIDTTRKCGNNILDALVIMMLFRPE